MGHHRSTAALAALTVGAALAAQPAQGQNTDEQLRKLNDELRDVKAQIEALKRQSEADSARDRRADPTAPPAAGAAPAAGAPADTRAPEQPPSVPAGSAVYDRYAARYGYGIGVSLFGYGEITYGRSRNRSSDAVADVRRGILGFGYRFDERTRFVAELEIEHAVVAADTDGEATFEQFYIERDLSDRTTANMGLFLIPLGYLNEVHEPTRFYGVNRNLVETAIIPSTWREIGAGLRGRTENGLRWDAGIVTGFNLNKWDPDGSSAGGALRPLRQEGEKAAAGSLSFYGALNYNGIAGLNVGGGLFTGGAGQKQPNFAGNNAKITLAELHTRWQPGRWDLSALYAVGRISGAGDYNATLAPGQTNPVPNRFAGWYLQGAYRAWRGGDYSVVPFMRYEWVNTAMGYDGLPVGFSASIADNTRVVTAGANFYLNPQVVVKLDFQRYLNDNNSDRFNLGLGFHY